MQWDGKQIGGAGRRGRQRRLRAGRGAIWHRAIGCVAAHSRVEEAAGALFAHPLAPLPPDQHQAGACWLLAQVMSLQRELDADELQQQSSPAGAGGQPRFARYLAAAALQAEAAAEEQLLLNIPAEDRSTRAR